MFTEYYLADFAKEAQKCKSKMVAKEMIEAAIAPLKQPSNHGDDVSQDSSGECEVSKLI